MSANVETQYRIPTTCVECGAKGEAETSVPGLVHKTILCEDCKQELRVGKARLAVDLKTLDPEAAFSFELAGTDLFLVSLVPNVSQLVSMAVRLLNPDSETRETIGEETSRALEAVIAAEAYDGKFVKVTRSEQAARSDNTTESRVPNGTASAVPPTEGELTT